MNARLAWPPIASAPAQWRDWAPSLVFLGATALAVGGGVLTALVHPLAGVATLAALVGGLIVVQSVQAALFAVIGVLYLLPFGVIPLNLLGGLRPTFLDATVTLLLLTVLFRQLRRADERLVLTPLAGPLLLFLGIALAAFVLGIESTSSEAARFFLKAINSFLLYFSVVNVLRTRLTLEMAVRSIMLAGVAAAGIALLLYALSPDLANRLLNLLRVVGYPSGDVLRYIAGTEVQRAIGTAVDPNILGGMLILVLPLLLVQLLGAQPLLPRRALLLGVALVIIALLLTYSRSAWTGGVAAALVIAAVRYRRAAFVLAGVLALLVFLPQGEIFVERFQAGVSFEDRAAQMRLGEYKDALTLIQAYPWLGVGFGAAPEVDLYVAVASIYLLIAEQMGLLGLSAFLLIVIVFLAWTLPRQLRIRDEGLRSVQLGAVASVIGALTAGLFDHYFVNFQFPHTVALLWLTVALAAAATRLGEQEGSVDEHDTE